MAEGIAVSGTAVAVPRCGSIAHGGCELVWLLYFRGLHLRSSKEAKLVATDDIIAQALWTKLFLEAQGYLVKDNVLYQDNQSAILLEKNGKASSGKRTWHLNIHYFFLTDQVINNNVSIQLCRTDDMTADYMTKPLQGKKFNKFRKAIMNT